MDCYDSEPMRRHVLRFFALVIAAVVVATVAGGGYLRIVLGRSLPVTDGTLRLAGLAQPVTVTRDALGVPTIKAQSRVDLARAVGFVHAQERFFQMDLQRRQPAGELSALVGPATVNADRAMRIHRFRHIAREALTYSPPEYKAELEAYAAGVNAGLAALAAPPFEYLVLRTTPEPWTPEDSMLTAIAMYVTLQGAQRDYEADARRDARRRCPSRSSSSWPGAPAIGRVRLSVRQYPVPPIPGPRRRRRARRHTVGPARRGTRRRERPRGSSARRPAPRRLAALVGAAAARGGRPRSAATTGRCRARVRRPAAPSSPTTCTCGCRCRTSGSGPPTSIPTSVAPARPAGWTG